MNTPTKKISAVAARLITALQFPGMRTLDTIDRLNARLLSMGFGDACSRCWGSGKFGPQSVQGGVCFGCNGKRTVAPKLTKELEKRVMLAIEAGELQAYAARMIAADAARKAVAGQYDRAFEDQFKSAWYAHFYADGRGNAGVPAYPLNHQIHDMIEPFAEAARSANFVIKFGKGTPEDVTACIAAIAAWRNAVAQCDRAHALCLERGLYAAAHEAYSEANGVYEAQRKVHARFQLVAESLWSEVA